ncbi:hypothetical protein [Thioalkalivibrio sp. ALMg11]|uniref:hypothetical protein n=1 Tax=Thioalkalivibrio sp. ALMg11 TaxID=1158165 RepID=UPI00035C9377|nr:hypothetical protein [Thioalkalivibrio sp. ALMg11]
MARWKRARSNGPERITIHVQPDRDPELYEWLMAQPYGAASKKARSMLIDAIRAENDGGQEPADPPKRKEAPAAQAAPSEPARSEVASVPAEAPEKPQPPETAPEPSSEQAPPQAARKASPEGEGTGQEGGTEDIDPETLRIMQDSMDQF